LVVDEVFRMHFTVVDGEEETREKEKEGGEVTNVGAGHEKARCEP